MKCVEVQRGVFVVNQRLGWGKAEVTDIAMCKTLNASLAHPE